MGFRCFSPGSAGISIPARFSRRIAGVDAFMVGDILDSVKVLTDR